MGGVRRAQADGLPQNANKENPNSTHGALPVDFAQQRTPIRLGEAMYL